MLLPIFLMQLVYEKEKRCAWEGEGGRQLVMQQYYMQLMSWWRMGD
jgi:hypothetical protein